MLPSVVGPQRDAVSAWNAVTQCFELSSGELVLWFTFVLSINVHSVHSTKNSLMAVVPLFNLFQVIC